MARPGGVRRLFRLVIGRRAIEDTVDLELEHHLAMRADQFIEEGYAPDEARRLAEQMFGDRGRHRAACVREQRREARMAWWSEVMSSAVQDVRYAFRGIRKQPGFALAVVATLGIGIGANTAIFTVVDSTILHPLPFENPEELYEIQARYEKQALQLAFFDAGSEKAWVAEGSPFERIGFHARERVTVVGADEVEAIPVQGVTPNVFELVGVLPERGRPFGAGDTEPGAERVVIVSTAYWARALGSDPDVVGKEIELDELPYRIVGVMPRGFRFPTWALTDMWVPFMDDGTVAGRAPGQVQTVLRISPDEVEAVEERATAFAAGMQEYGPGGGEWGVGLLPMNVPSVNRSTQRALWVTFGAVGLMLLIALVNSVNLMLARATTRGREIGVRLALGGSRTRVAVQILVESLVLALLGGAAAMALAHWGVEAALAIAPTELTTYNARPIEIGGRVVAFAGGLSVAVGLLFGALPALRGVTRARATSAAAIGSYASSSRAHNRFRGALVAGQIALSLALLFGAGVMARSFAHLVRVDPGFEVDGLAVLTMSISEARYPSAEAREAFSLEIRERIAQHPGVTEATRSVGVPPGTGIVFGDGIWLDGETEPAVDADLIVPYVGGDHNMLEVLRARLLAGRLFRADDDPGARTVVIDTDLAAVFGGPERAVGRSFRLKAEGAPRVVLGVVDDLKLMGVDTRFSEYSYVSLNGPAEYRGFVTFAFRTDGPVEPIAATVRDIVAQIDPKQPISGVETVEKSLWDAVAQPRFFLVLMSVFAALAAILAGVGLYGVLSFAVSQRVHELGIRQALGASSARVRRTVLLGGLRVATIGVVAGALLSARAAGALQELLFETSARDGTMLAAVAVLMFGVTALASWIPARRATMVDPVEVLKAE